MDIWFGLVWRILFVFNVYMGNRQINHYAFVSHTILPNVYCDTVLSYDTINMKMMDSLDTSLTNSHSQVLRDLKAFILAAMVYLIRENDSKMPYTLTYLFYKNGVLVLKIVHNPKKIEPLDTPNTYYHIQCDLDMLFVTPTIK